MSRVLPGFGQDDPSAGLRAGLPVCRASGRVTVCVGCAAGSRCVSDVRDARDWIGRPVLRLDASPDTRHSTRKDASEEGDECLCRPLQEGVRKSQRGSQEALG